MSERNMRIVFSSGISNLTARNSSFDSGVLRVAYTGRNRNNSFISKETFERCMPSIYNCPIVCRYDRENDSIGSHDMELVSSDDGGLRIVNITQPVGVVPESANYWWEEIEDDSGVHEYLCVDVLVWKRQEAYKKIKEDGITDESMEISVKEGSMTDGVYVIKRFEFTAFCLLGSAEPCYESASLEMFSRDDFKRQLAEMMQEFKESFSLVSTPNGAQDTHPQISMEGGEEVLDKMELLAKYGLTAEQLDFDLDALTYEQLEEKLAAENGGAEPTAPEAEPTDPSEPSGDGAGEPDGEGAGEGNGEGSESDGEDNGGAGEGEPENFALLGEQFHEELLNALCVETVQTAFGEMSRYCYIDYDAEANEVYAYDMEDWKLYGFKYSMNGDNVVVDFTSKTHKKFAIVDFDEGEQTAAFAAVFAVAAEKYQSASDTITSMENELGALRQFKTDTENAAMQGEREKVFAQFEDLVGVEAFENLRENCGDMKADVLEEKCYAIRGKYGTVAKFSFEGQKAPKLKVPKSNVGNEPYGGIFAEYGIMPKAST